MFGGGSCLVEEFGGGFGYMGGLGGVVWQKVWSRGLGRMGQGLVGGLGYDLYFLFLKIFINKLFS